MDKLNEYEQVMEQVDYPEGVKSRQRIVCTQKQADESIGELYKDNPSWRIIEMNFIKPSPLGA